MWSNPRAASTAVTVPCNHCGAALSRIQRLTLRRPTDGPSLPDRSEQSNQLRCKRSDAPVRLRRLAQRDPACLDPFQSAVLGRCWIERFKRLTRRLPSWKHGDTSRGFGSRLLLAPQVREVAARFGSAFFSAIAEPNGFGPGGMNSALLPWK